VLGRAALAALEEQQRRAHDLPFVGIPLAPDAFAALPRSQLIEAHGGQLDRRGQLALGRGERGQLMLRPLLRRRQLFQPLLRPLLGGGKGGELLLRPSLSIGQLRKTLLHAIKAGGELHYRKESFPSRVCHEQAWLFLPLSFRWPAKPLAEWSR
jgi:hypothetical protein